MRGAKKQQTQAAREPQVVCLHLTGGSSDDATWVLEEGVGGTFLTVGSDPECEWQIRAPGVPPHALSLLLIGGMVYVRGGAQRGARLDGVLLSEDWQHVEADARLDFGLARLEVRLGKGALLPSLRDVRVPPAATFESEVSGARRAPVQPEGSGMRPSHAALQARERAQRERRARRAAGTAARRSRRASQTWLYLLGAAALAVLYVVFVIWLDTF